MNRLNKILLWGCAVVLCSCSSKPTPKTIPNIIKRDTDVVRRPAHPIVFGSAKTLEIVYVTNRNGADAKEEISDNSTTLSKYPYGESLFVIEVKDGWLGIMAGITRNYKEKGLTTERYGWEKVYVKTGNTGKLSDLKLVQSDLNIISSLTKNKKTENFERGTPLKDYLEFTLISKDEFESKKATAVNFFVADTTAIIKKSGVIELPYGNKIKRYIDKPDAEDDVEIYSYIGKIPFLEKYVITGLYWESGDYKLVDKVTGKETNSLGAFPYISPDKKHMMDITYDGYESTTYIELYLIEGANIKNIMIATFNKWMADERNMFWSTDGYFYAPIIFASASSKEDGTPNDNYQYIKIKVKP